MRLDHLSYAVSVGQLVDTVQRLGLLLGGTFVDGGRHPGFGTRNFVLALEGGVYVEVVAALDHPAADTAPFGRAVRRRGDEGGGWLSWVMAVPDISVIESRLGRRAVEAGRVRPDGDELSWRQLGVLEVMEDPAVPFFVQWHVGAERHPAAAPLANAPTLVGLEIAGHARTVDDYVGIDVAHAVAPVAVTWTPPPSSWDTSRWAAAGLVAARFRTRHGDVRID